MVTAMCSHYIRQSHHHPIPLLSTACVFNQMFHSANQKVDDILVHFISIYFPEMLLHDFHQMLSGMIFATNFPTVAVHARMTLFMYL